MPETRVQASGNSRGKTEATRIEEAKIVQRTLANPNEKMFEFVLRLEKFLTAQPPFDSREISS